MALNRPGELISRYALADLHAWGDRHVVKLYRADCAEEVAEREAAKARTVRAMGIHTPEVVDVVKVEDRVGVVYDKPDGPTMLQELLESPDKAEEYGRLLAALHADLHARAAPDLPSQRAQLHTNILRAKGLLEDRKAVILERLESLPDDRAACHGAFEPGSVVLGSGDPMILGWSDAGRGTPLADVVRTSLLLALATPPLLPDPTQVHAFASVRATFHAAYLQRYGELRPYEETDLLAWELPVAAARLSELVSVSEYNALVLKVGDALRREA